MIPAQGISRRPEGHQHVRNTELETVSVWKSLWTVHYYITTSCVTEKLSRAWIIGSYAHPDTNTLFRHRQTQVIPLSVLHLDTSAFILTHSLFFISFNAASARKKLHLMQQTEVSLPFIYVQWRRSQSDQSDTIFSILNINTHRGALHLDWQDGGPQARCCGRLQTSIWSGWNFNLKLQFGPLVLFSPIFLCMLFGQLQCVPYSVTIAHTIHTVKKQKLTDL